MRGVGIGFRRDIAEDLLSLEGKDRPAFVELAPENWMSLGGASRQLLLKVAEKYPITAHGLSLSIGSPDKIDSAFVNRIKDFLDLFQINYYTEHLSFSTCDNVHLYDLLPIPFTQGAVSHISDKITQVQDILKRELILENVSYYTTIEAEMDELEFIKQISNKSGCKFLLDVNNVFVNSFNHSYNPYEFIRDFPIEKVEYIHMAGHLQVSDDLIIDTHGEAISEPVIELYKEALSLLKPLPVLLERDFNFPENLSELWNERNYLQSIYDNCFIKKQYYAS